MRQGKLPIRNTEDKPQLELWSSARCRANLWHLHRQHRLLRLVNLLSGMPAQSETSNGGQVSAVCIPGGYWPGAGWRPSYEPGGGTRLRLFPSTDEAAAGYRDAAHI